MGDSLSAGYGIDLDKSWPILLQQRLLESGYPHEVVNASISGETTAGGLRRLPELLNRYAPVVVVVELGANDGLRGLNLQHIDTNLRRIIELIGEGAAKPLAIKMLMPGNYGPKYADGFEKIYDGLDGFNGAEVVPFFMRDVVLNASMMQADGLHPTANAQPLMLEPVWMKLESVLPNQVFMDASK